MHKLWIPTHVHASIKCKPICLENTDASFNRSASIFLLFFRIVQNASNEIHWFDNSTEIHQNGDSGNFSSTNDCDFIFTHSHTFTNTNTNTGLVKKVFDENERRGKRNVPKRRKIIIIDINKWHTISTRLNVIEDVDVKQNHWCICIIWL